MRADSAASEKNFDAPNTGFDAPNTDFDAPNTDFDAPNSDFDASNRAMDASETTGPARAGRVPTGHRAKEKPDPDPRVCRGESGSERIADGIPLPSVVAQRIVVEPAGSRRLASVLRGPDAFLHGTLGDTGSFARNGPSDPSESEKTTR